MLSPITSCASTVASPIKPAFDDPLPILNWNFEGVFPHDVVDIAIRDKCQNIVDRPVRITPAADCYNQREYHQRNFGLEYCEKQASE